MQTLNCTVGRLYGAAFDRLGSGGLVGALSSSLTYAFFLLMFSSASLTAANVVSGALLGAGGAVFFVWELP